MPGRLLRWAYQEKYGKKFPEKMPGKALYIVLSLENTFPHWETVSYKENTGKTHTIPMHGCVFCVSG